MTERIGIVSVTKPNEEPKKVEEKPIIKKPEPTGDDEIEPRSCKNCVHLKSCGAVWMTRKMVNEFHKEFGGWIEFPFPVAMLALKCKEFVDKRKVVMPDKK